ncbi:MAG: hypothetical protein ACYCS1_10540 [Gammaproteobacteria bacterium]
MTVIPEHALSRPSVRLLFVLVGCMAAPPVLLSHPRAPIVPTAVRFYAKPY